VLVTLEWNLLLRKARTQLGPTAVFGRPGRPRASRATPERYHIRIYPFRNLADCFNICHSPFVVRSDIYMS
jgi:hypothetical protein